MEQSPAPQTNPGVHYVKLTLAVVSVAIGCVMLLTSLFTLDFPGLLIALAIVLPGGWWFLHERKDKAGSPMKRHWGGVALVAIVAFVGGGMLLPAEDPADEAVAEVETASVSPAPTRSTVRVTTNAESATTSAEPNTATSTIIRPESKPEKTPAPTRHDPAPQRTVTPTPAPVPVPNPAPAPESPGVVTGRTVTAGAFCKDVETGMTGQTSTGLIVTCTKYPGESRSRWRQ